MDAKEPRSLVAETDLAWGNLDLAATETDFALVNLHVMKVSFLHHDFYFLDSIAILTLIHHRCGVVPY